MRPLFSPGTYSPRRSYRTEYRSFNTDFAICSDSAGSENKKVWVADQLAAREEAFRTSYNPIQKTSSRAITEVNGQNLVVRWHIIVEAQAAEVT